MSQEPYFVAEISANHLGSLDRALELIEAAHNAGANAVKIQTYKPETMTLDLPENSVSKNHKLWGGRSLYQLYSEAMTPWEWHPQLFNYAREIGIEIFSSPFDRSAVDFLEGLKCPIYKIASLETGDIDLIEYVASKKKPILISSGASTLNELQLAVQATGSNRSNVTVLLCTSSYPADPKDAHLHRLATLRALLDTKVGISDHTLGVGVSLAAIALGARIVEKHFTLSRDDGGPDSAFSLEPNEFSNLVKEGKHVFEALGNESWSLQDSEKESRRLRRSLFIVKNVKAGEIATRHNVKALRPNSGGDISSMSLILGKKFVRDFKIGSAATLECVEDTREIKK